MELYVTMNNRQIIGRKGESIATAYLRSIGYKLYRRNTRLSRDEIDIIAYDPTDKVIVFTEVKTRAVFDRDYHPSLNMTGPKKKNTLRSARRWVARHNYKGGYRIDLVCVAGRKVVDHVKEINFNL